MELIRRKILLEPFIDRGNNSPNYGNLTATTFFLNIFLTNTIEDIGMFDNVDFVPSTNSNPAPVNYDLRLTGKVTSDYFYIPDSIITGQTESRIQDVTSYSKNRPLDVDFDVSKGLYVDFKGNLINGVSRVTSSVDPLTYVFDANVNDINIGTINQRNGLVFIDTTATTLSTFAFRAEGKNETNTSLSAITKQEYLFGITEQPEVKSDVFIDRGNISVFEKHLKLSEITNINELTRYGKGFFNITVQ